MGKTDKAAYQLLKGENAGLRATIEAKDAEIEEIAKKLAAFSDNRAGGPQNFYERRIAALEQELATSKERIQQLHASHERKDTEIAEAKLVADAGIAIAQAPYPLHDYCSKEQWETLCHAVAAIDDAREE